jgi:acyl dehydratase
MPIDVSKALHHELPRVESSYDADDVILYHLGVGAGNPPTDANELEYTYESKLKVLPSFGVIPVFKAIASVASVPGLTFNPMMVLHGEQDLTVHKRIPSAARLTSVARVANIWDKGKAAVVELEVESRDEKGEPLFTNVFTLFLRGEGGFGGERGPEKSAETPTRAPDRTVESVTLPQQALLYRLSGDKNPLHADPGFAKLGGFDRPILHGLCSFGIACKAAIDTMVEGKVERVARYQARFAGVMFPGETLVTSLWRDGERISLTASSKERNSPVLSQAVLTLR